MSVPPLLNNNKSNVKLNNYQSLSDDTSMFIIIDPPVSFSSSSILTITGSTQPDDETPVRTKVLPLSPFIESPLFNIND